MTIELATLLLSMAALAVTIVGWSVTYRRQREILEIQRRYQEADRDLLAYRSRFPKATRVIGVLHDMVFGFHSLPAMYVHFLSVTDPLRFQELAREHNVSKTSIDRLPSAMRELPVLLNDPEYVALIHSLPKDATELIRDAQGEVFAAYESTTDIREELSDLVRYKIPAADPEDDLQVLVEEFQLKLPRYKELIAEAMEACVNAAKYISIALALHEQDLIQQNEGSNE